MKGKLTKKIKGTAVRPRLAVFRSSKHIYAQVIDDDKCVTLASTSNAVKKSGQASGKHGKKIGNNVDGAKHVGEEIAKRCLAAGIKKVVFDRCGYLYHGRVAALANAARSAGLEF